MNATYPSPVQSLTDAELVTLSAELEEAYCSEDRDGFTDWADDDAYRRYREMGAEKHRRFVLANPGWKPTPVNEMVQMMARLALSSLASQVDTSVARYIMAGPKIGDTVSVRRPQPFVQG